MSCPTPRAAEFSDHYIGEFTVARTEGKQRGVQSVSGCSRECHYFLLKYAKQVNLHPQGCRWSY